MRYYLGLDGGGTKTAAVILDENRRETGSGFGGPCNIATGDDAALAVSVKQATESALKSAGLPRDTRFAGVCAGVAGYTAKSRRVEFSRILADCIPADSHRVDPDFAIAYWGASNGEPGIIVIAGTGAGVFGRTADGKTARADGRGYILGDRGSGFRMGLQALKRIVQFEEEQIPHLSLSRQILDSIGAADLDDVVEWLYRDFTPSRVAALMEVLAAAGEEGDPEARHILRSGARALANGSVRLVARKLGIDEGPLRLYLAGGIWDGSPYYRTAFERAIIGPGGNWKPTPSPVEILEPLNDAAYGAALLALSSPA
jgi:N-acetylglucosamine kinase-like BadF-type ATPase